MATKIDANTPLKARGDFSLAKHFYLTQKESLLVIRKLEETEEDMLADTSLFKLEETGEEWFREELHYIIEKLETISDNELAVSSIKKISKYLY